MGVEVQREQPNASKEVKERVFKAGLEALQKEVSEKGEGLDKIIASTMEFTKVLLQVNPWLAKMALQIQVNFLSERFGDQTKNLLASLKKEVNKTDVQRLSESNETSTLGERILSIVEPLVNSPTNYGFWKKGEPIRGEERGGERWFDCLGVWWEVAKNIGLRDKGGKQIPIAFFGGNSAKRWQPGEGFVNKGKERGWIGDGKTEMLPMISDKVQTFGPYAYNTPEGKTRALEDYKKLAPGSFIAFQGHVGVHGRGADSFINSSPTGNDGVQDMKIKEMFDWGYKHYGKLQYSVVEPQDMKVA